MISFMSSTNLDKYSLSDDGLWSPELRAITNGKQFTISLMLPKIGHNWVLEFLNNGIPSMFTCKVSSELGIQSVIRFA